jgi:hypothetical protein
MRYIKWLIVSLALVLIIIYYTGGYIARELLKYGLEYEAPELARQGITIKQFDYGNVRLYSFNSFTVRDVNIKFNLEKEIYGKKSFSAEFFAKSVIVRIANLKDPTIRLTLKDFDLYIQSNEEKPDRPFGKFENAYWKGEAPIRLFDYRKSGEVIIKKFNTLFRENSIPDPIEFNGVALLNLDGNLIKIRMYTERNDHRTFLIFNEEDILNASKDFSDVDISEEAAKLISKYPARALHIMKITRDARRISENLKSKHSDFPDDAFKHIYWSYHLSKTFGPDFAKDITDAHETLPNNTPQQRTMDFHNNEIGRKLASENLNIEELKNFVLNNPEVIRFPYQIQ